MPFSLRQLADRLFTKPQPAVAPVDPLSAFRTADGSLAVRIDSCVLRDGSMIIKAPGLHGFAIGLEKVLDKVALKEIISVAFKQKMKLSHNISDDAYSFEFNELADKNGYAVRISPRPSLPSVAKPKL